MEGLIPLAFSALKRHKSRRLYHSFHTNSDAGLVHSHAFGDSVSRSASSSPVVAVEERSRHGRSRSLAGTGDLHICSSGSARNDFKSNNARKQDSNGRNLVVSRAN